MEHPATERYRLFIAIEAPESLKDRLEQVQRDLRVRIPGPALRWTKRDQFHLTLKFLGSVEVGKVPALVSAIRESTSAFAPLAMRARGLGCFPNIRRPRVSWAGVTDANAVLPDLQQRIESASAPFASEPAAPEGKFQGHITLARIKDITRPEITALASSIEKLAGFDFGEWIASRVDIMRSQLSPKGAVYTSVASIELRA